ncbi:hypothetical protein [Dubosiella newyorkensis]|uniref:hypothetical protein n=1 Tax=Dubosiella newyorkensis TaxID=1862672 RepID=UPI003F67FC2D
MRKKATYKEAQSESERQQASSKGLAPAASLFRASRSQDRLRMRCKAWARSAMGAANLTKKLKAAGIDITVPHSALNEVLSIRKSS